jgi:hypothetical protein
MLNIQNNSDKKGRNNDTIPAKKPPTVNAITTVQMCVIVAVIANIKNTVDAIAFIA